MRAVLAVRQDGVLTTGHQRCDRRAEPERGKGDRLCVRQCLPGIRRADRQAATVTVTDTAPTAGQNDEREQKSMSRETYETYSAAEPEKIDLIAFLAEYFQAFREILSWACWHSCDPCMGGGSFLTAKLRYQPVYEAYTSFVVGSNRAVGYSYYDNVTAAAAWKDLSVSRDKRRTEGCCSAGSSGIGSGDIRN